MHINEIGYCHTPTVLIENKRDVSLLISFRAHAFVNIIVYFGFTSMRFTEPVLNNGIHLYSEVRIIWIPITIQIAFGIT